MEAMRSSSVFSSLGTKVLQQAVFHLKEQSCVSRQVIYQRPHPLSLLLSLLQSRKLPTQLLLPNSPLHTGAGDLPAG